MSGPGRYTGTVAPSAPPRGHLGGVPHVVGVTVGEQHGSNAHTLGLKDLADQVLDAGRRVDNKGCARPGRDEHKPIAA